LKRWSLGALVVLAVIGVVVARRRPAPPPRIAPAVAYRDAPASIPADDGIEDRAMALAVGSLTPAERKKLLEAMEYASTRLEGSVTPGADDLGEGDPVTELETTTKKYMPSLSAARSLARGRASAKDASARVIASCDDPSIAKDEKCVALWADDREGSRARFLLWAASNAVVLETESPAACATALREHALDDGSAIALVLASDDLTLASIPEREVLKDAAHRLGRALAVTKRKDEGRQLDALGRAAPPPGRALPWLEVSPSTVVVVPRLSALTRLGELRSAVLGAPSCRGVRWIHPAGG
jgi:hypothetical protein